MTTNTWGDTVPGDLVHPCIDGNVHSFRAAYLSTLVYKVRALVKGGIEVDDWPHNPRFMRSWVKVR